MGYLEEFGHDLVFTSAHFGARPEHEVWQGKAFSLSGAKTVDGVHYNPDFYRTTEYGDITGIYGVNCRHSHGPYFPGTTELPTIEEKRDGMTSEQYYKATQKQRGYERNIRNKKREIYNAEKAGVDSTQFRLKLGKQQRLLKNHVDSKGLVRQYSREKAYAVGGQPRGLRRNRPSATIGVAEPKRLKGANISKRTPRVDLDYINSDNYLKNFSFIADENTRLFACETARTILKHRNGTSLEDYYAISLSTKTYTVRNTTSKIPRQVKHSPGEMQAISNAPKGDLLIMHNHTGNMPPSFIDFIDRDFTSIRHSLILCHDGSVYRYRVVDRELFAKAEEQARKAAKQHLMSDYDRFIGNNAVYFGTPTGNEWLDQQIRKRFGVSFERLG